MKSFDTHRIWKFARILAASLVVATVIASCQQSTTPSGPAGTPSDPSSYPDANLLVSASWLHAHLTDPSVRVVDLSPIRNYQHGHIPGAVHIWWQDTIEIHNDVYGMMVGSSGVEQLVHDAGITAQSDVVLYDASGDRWAARFLWVLNANGFSNVKLLNGGRQAWEADHYALSTSTPPVAAGHLDLKLDYSVLIGVNDVTAHLQDSSYVFVDNRTASELNQTWYDTLRIGRIPGAKLVPWSQMTMSGSVPYYETVSRLSNLFAHAGVTPEKTVVVYGIDGVEAAQTYFVLRLLGYPKVLVFDGSWAQWGVNSSLPIQPLPTQTGQAISSLAAKSLATP